MTTNTDPVRALIDQWRAASEFFTGDAGSDIRETLMACARELESALASAPQPSFDRRFAEMLIGILGDVQDELGFTDEEKMCANGSAEIVSAIRELKERAASAPPSAPVGDDPIDASDNAEYIEHCADRLERLGLRVTAGALRVIAHEHRALLAERDALERDAARYRQWRDKMISQDHNFIEAMRDSLPGAVGRIRPPTADEWGAAIDATMQSASHRQEVPRG